MGVAIIDTGVSNTASVRACVRRATGAAPELTTEAGVIERAERVILPGVGSFAAGMAALERWGLVGVIRDRVERGRPLLAICLGMQLLGESSEESPGAGGIGAIAMRSERFDAGNGVRVPHFGWNAVAPGEGMDGVERGHAYFAHSYRVTEAPAGWSAARCEHGGRFVAAVQRGSVVACQFHPELSGVWGAALVRRWAAAPAREEATA